MNTAKIFNSGNSQAIRLPKVFRLKGKEAYITKVGDALVILPKKKNWEQLFDSLHKFSDDFMKKRDQPETQEREAMFG
ncbi:MAG: antitoxin [Ignavibacteriaceae bacterium]|nr:antitoxin [Ignavibacteriaceae bacterium]